jgi:hypothetical protein
MAKPTQFTWSGLLLRFVFALILVLGTYNPWGFSIYDWFVNDPNGWKESLPLKAFALIILIIGWAIYLRATWRSLGPIGLFLALAFFGTIVWLLVYYGGLTLGLDGPTVVIVEVVLAAVLAVGMTWSLIRRRLTGQMDVDEISEGED